MLTHAHVRGKPKGVDLCLGQCTSYIDPHPKLAPLAARLVRRSQRRRAEAGTLGLWELRSACDRERCRWEDGTTRTKRPTGDVSFQGSKARVQNPTFPTYRTSIFSTGAEWTRKSKGLWLRLCSSIWRTLCLSCKWHIDKAGMRAMRKTGARGPKLEFMFGRIRSRLTKTRAKLSNGPSPWSNLR